MENRPVLPEPIAVTLQVVRVLERLGVRYIIGGSLASTAYGLVRTTQDTDILADLRPEHLPALAATLQTDFYADDQMMAEALARRSSFNIIHRQSMFKVDIFLPRGRPFDESQLARATHQQLTADVSAQARLATAEDTLLAKLDWYRSGNEVSERQWRDVLGVLKVQGERLDFGYLWHWAAELGVSDLLERAISEAA